MRILRRIMRTMGRLRRRRHMAVDSIMQTTSLCHHRRRRLLSLPTRTPSPCQTTFLILLILLPLPLRSSTVAIAMVHRWELPTVITCTRLRRSSKQRAPLPSVRCGASPCLRRRPLTITIRTTVTVSLPTIPISIPFTAAASASVLAALTSTTTTTTPPAPLIPHRHTTAQHQRQQQPNPHPHPRTVLARRRRMAGLQARAVPPPKLRRGASAVLIGCWGIARRGRRRGRRSAGGGMIGRG
ncbi:hypothetical protein IWZ03DRAFT_365674 [Phyllosticta citriasiana]|uniref:Uncharacterized protein n=1 Tax=Phyllosticta citriasiana TaxID=595635 RepID=A0ABR1KYC4_9PEZI